MTAPSFLATEYAFTELVGVTDVQTIMNSLATMLTSTLTTTATNPWPNGQRWTNPSGTTYLGPSDAGGKFMQITLTRTTITRLRFQVNDIGGQVSDGEIQIAAGGSQVEIYAGPGHCVVTANNGGTWETFRAFMADPTPEPLSANNSSYLVATGHRNNAGTVQNTNMLSWNYRFYGGTLSQSVLFVYGNYAVSWFPAQAASVNTHLMTQAGSNVAIPYYQACPSANGVDDWKPSGKNFQIILVDSNLAPGSDQSVPIDTGVVGVFRIIRMAPQRSLLMAVRKG